MVAAAERSSASPDGGALLEVSPRRHRPARPDRRRRARRGREDARLRGARQVGAVGLVRRPGARGRRRAGRHGRPRDRHRPVPPRRAGAGRVCAAVGTRYSDYAVDDDAVLLISWSNGTNSVVESGWWQPHLGGLEAETEVYGTGGYARIFGYTEPPTPDYEHCPQSMYTAQMAEFCDALREGRPPTPTGADGRVVMRVVEDAYRSAGVLGGRDDPRPRNRRRRDEDPRRHRGRRRGGARVRDQRPGQLGGRRAPRRGRVASRGDPPRPRGRRRRVGRPRRRRRSASRASTGTPTCPG